MSELPETVGVVGGGRMGSGIAQAVAVTGASVVLIEQDADAVALTNARLRDAVAKAVERGSVTDAAAVLDRVDTTDDYAALRSCGLVIEAVPESLLLKIESLRRAESAAPEDAWLATNTSSLSVADLAEHLRRPERFCGLHFFNPVPASTLVEIVIAPRTSDELRANARRWVGALGKASVVVQDSPGFASSRLGLVIALEAMRMLEDGVASAEDIDRAMELGYRHATGPLRTSDLVGLDVRLGVAEYLHEQLGARFEPPRILREKVANGELGRKSGRGFFDYRGS